MKIDDIIMIIYFIAVNIMAIIIAMNTPIGW